MPTPAPEPPQESFRPTPLPEPAPDQPAAATPDGTPAEPSPRDELELPFDDAAAPPAESPMPPADEIPPQPAENAVEEAPAAPPQPPDTPEATEPAPELPPSEKPVDELDDLFNDSTQGSSGATNGVELARLKPRHWQDNTGRYSCQGRLVHIMPNAVRILKQNGKMSTVPLARLSQQDLRFVHAQADAAAARQAQSARAARL
jgi:hypothetical protein